jgi:RimJ/RimL family protein N-acetyltransferase
VLDKFLQDRTDQLEQADPVFDPGTFHATETLSDGRKVEIRAQRPEDRQGLRTAIGRKSPQSSYHRFFAVKREFSEKEAHFFLDIDFVNHVALVAEATEDGRPAIVGGCRYIVIAPARAEVAFSVIDAYQGKGLGTALMRHLAAIGREAGIEEFVAEVLSDNAPMLKVFERSGLALTTRREGTVVHVSMRYQGPAEAGAACESSLTSRT